MNPALRVAWSIAASAAGTAAFIAGQTNTDSAGKIRRSLALRHGVRTRIAAHRDQRSSQRPLCWLHAPSVGEGLQARPILQALREYAPHCQLAFSYFSPSASAFAETLVHDGLADWTEVLPFDSGINAELILESWQPTVLVFVKLDVWPVLSERAAARGVPTALVSATLAANSSRLGWMAQALLRDAYRSLSAVGAIATADAERLVQLGVRPGVITVTGDTRMDQVATRAAGVGRSHPVRRLRAQGHGARGDIAASLSSPPGQILVAGSTWPADEAMLLPAFEQWRAAYPEARLIIAPHEPTAPHLAPIESWARELGVRLARLGEAEHQPATEWEVLLVDRVGVLGDLYALADCAFVGGGFHEAGLHSVLEPAAFGAPVLFGPQHRNAREAELLVQTGGAHVVTDAASLAAQLSRWSASEPERTAAGTAARDLVAASQGSTARVLELLQSLAPALRAP